MRETSQNPRLVVGVGASGGGLAAFRELLAVLPPKSGMAFVLVQHLTPAPRTLLSDLLSPGSTMVIRQAEHELKLQDDTIYIVKPNTSTAIRNGRFDVREVLPHQGLRLPINYLFASLAQDCRERSVGLVLTGAGSDGSAGLREIKAVGGLALVQDPLTCEHADMPRNAIDSGAVDLILTIPDLPAALLRFADMTPEARASQTQGGSPQKASEGLQLKADELASLHSILLAEADFDLQVYKQPTVERRVMRRLQVAGFTDMGAYLERLRQDPAEQKFLVRDLLINVTDFFRDADAFRVLRKIVIDPLVERSEAQSTLRVWVPGCATGEEPYSIAIEFLDAIAAAGKELSLQIFATDISSEALAVGRAGRYPASIAERIPQDRLHRYFEEIHDRGYQVRPTLRDAVSFAQHDLTKDPPFARMQLVSCRNVLIYLTTNAQEHVLKILHFALVPDGQLLLSTSESTGRQQDLFATTSKSQRLYRKVGISSPLAIPTSPTLNRTLVGRSGEPLLPASGPASAAAAPQGDSLRRVVLDALLPPTIVVSADGVILFSHGELGPYLRIPQGESPRWNLESIIRPAISMRTRGALYSCRRNQQPVVAIYSADGGSKDRVRITATPATELGEEAVILCFHAGDTHVTGEWVDQAAGATPGVFIEELERELRATRDDLRSSVEEVEAAKEELRASSEESMSIHEELQAANEELVAFSEELRSLNEELTAVNAQLRDKVDEVEGAYDDLNNFFASTGFATIFLDNSLCIKRFTPAAGELLSLNSDDNGRSIDVATHELLQSDLDVEAKSVLEHLGTQSREIQTKDGRWIARQVLPYRTETVEGVVVTLLDVSVRKRAIEELANREAQKSTIVSLGLHALREQNMQAFQEQVVGELRKTLGTEYSCILELQPGGDQLLLRAGLGWQPGLVGSTSVATSADSLAGHTLQSKDSVIAYDLTAGKRFSDSELLMAHRIESGLCCAIRDGDHTYGVLGAFAQHQTTFSRDDADFLQTAADIIGSAITRHQVRVLQLLELSVAKVLAEAVNVDSMFQELLKSLCAQLEASMSELWFPTPDGLALSRQQTYFEAPLSRDKIDSHFGTNHLTKGEGLVGRVFNEERAIWSTNLGNPAEFARPDEASALGLVTGFALPVTSTNTLLGVLSFFSPNRLFADNAFLQSLERIGRNIGDFVRRVQAEDRMTQSEARKTAIVNASLDGIITIDKDGAVVEFNAAAADMFGITPDQALGRELASLIIPTNQRDAHRNAVARVAGGAPTKVVGKRLELEALRQDGEEFPIELVITQIGSTEQPLFTGFIRDLTESKRMQVALREADRQKDEFLAMLGHELRNPLAAIRSAAELLRLSNTAAENPQLEQAQAVLTRQSAHMAKLLDGLLDISRIVRGKIDLDLEVVDLSALLREIVSDLSDSSKSRKLDLIVDIPPAPVWVDADRVRLTQIIDNVLSNALKFTDEDGSITVTLRVKDGAAQLSVLDTGAGIEAELLPHIFEAFRQSKQSFDRSHGGLGLGLALVRSLSVLHAGSVEAKSEGLGHGTELIVRLPTVKKPILSAEEVLKHVGPLHILVIEDNEDAAEMMQQVLQLWGYQVDLAFRGKEGVAMAKELRPNVILCDLGLPDGMSGFDVAQELRADPELAELCLIALSGYGLPEDKARGLEAGFNSHLTKPVDLKVLRNLLAEATQGTP